MNSKLSLNKRLTLISLSVLLPMAILVSYLLYLMHMSNHAFDEVTESATFANSYAEEFRERMDYSMYLAVIRGEPVTELEEGKVTVNGVQIVNPYSYVREMSAACDKMADLATVSSNRTLALRLKRTLNSLNDRIKEIDANLMETGKYDENMTLLRGNIYGLTEIIEDGIQDYVYIETDNFSQVRKSVLDRSHDAFQISVLAVIVAVILAVILTRKASQSVSRPIQQLCETVKQVAKGDFSARTDVQSQDEIAVLTDSFNDMTREIGQLVEDIKMEQSNLRITESKLLQAQINPHFLYNTLDTIVWLAEEKQTEDVVSMVTWLSDFFRTTLSKGRDFITVEEEKSHIDSYLKIQRFRYQDILDYEIDFQEDISDCVIPKLTLQPLVENALYHGIKMKRGKGRIVIHGFMEEKRLIFKVVDNGKGMTEEELTKLRRRIAGQQDSSRGGFGLANVNQRIHHYYGEEYGVFFESREGEGTEATIVVEAKKNLKLS